MNDSLPYATIPEAPETYTASTVFSRMIDGLGFRYYWATEGLIEKDLDYRPGNKGRTITETMDHLYNLSLTILKSAQKLPRDFSEKQQLLNINEGRKATLENLKMASMLFLETKDLAEQKVSFVRPKGILNFCFGTILTVLSKMRFGMPDR